jgi:hypothetical protein
MRIKDSVIISAIADLLDGQTSAGDRVYRYRTTPVDAAQSPIINVVSDRRSYELADRNGQGAYKETRRVAIVFMVFGEDFEDADTLNQWTVEKLDDLEEEIVDIIERDHQTFGLSGIMGMAKTEVYTEMATKDRLYAARYMIYDVIARYSVKDRRNDPA